MAILRRIPNSDQTRQRALLHAKRKMDNPGPAGNFLSPNVAARLTAICAAFSDGIHHGGAALSGQAGSSVKVLKAKLNLHTYISQFIQVFNFGVARGKYSKAQRAFFGLYVSSQRVPRMRTAAELTAWGQQIADGDAARVATGGAPMQNPDAAEVAVAYAAFITANTTQSVVMDEFTNALKSIKELRREANVVIKKVWDEVETFYNEKAPPAIRRRAREWGVIYLSTERLTFHITVRDRSTQQPLSGVGVKLTETGKKVRTNAAGQADLFTNISADECVLLFSREGYQDQHSTVTIGDEKEFAVEAVMEGV